MEGFSWVEERESEGRQRGRYLVPTELVREAPPLDTLSERTPAERPCEPSGVLFLRFAQLEWTEAAVQQFANQYGALGEPSSEPSEGRYDTVELDNGERVRASSLNLWKQQIWELRRAVELW